MSSSLLDSELDLYKEIYELIGSKIQFKTAEGEYEGVIKFILPKRQRVTIEHVYYVPTREYMGNLNFSLREFLAYKVVESSEKYEKWDYLSQILDRNYFGIRYRLNDLFDGELDEGSESDEHIPYSDEIFEDDFILKLPPNLQSELPQDNIILETIDAEFHQAISYISRQNVIGVSFEGPKISRLGKLSWVCISTPLCVFLFDIELLGKSAFDNGLRKIFQSKSIEKVIHDSREPSDCLLHMFDTELVYVFDTQVADYIVNMQRYSDRPVFKYVSSLDSCLVNHLDVPQEFINNRRKNLSYHDEVNFFMLRPISNDYRDVVIKNALYLILLQQKLTELMMNPFRKAVDVYLKVLANASEPEMLLDSSVPDMVPPALVMQGIQTVRFQEVPVDSPPISLVCKFKDPVKGTIIEPSKLSEIRTKREVSATSVVHSNMNESKKSSDKNSEKDIRSNVTKSAVNQDGWKIIKKSSDRKCSTVNKEKMNIINSKKHIDNVYHKLVNSLHGSGISKHIIDVKPSKDNICHFFMRPPFSTSNNKQNANSDAKLNLTTESCSDVTNDFPDCGDTWSRLRSDFGVEEKTLDSPKIRFLPAGM